LQEVRPPPRQRRWRFLSDRSVRCSVNLANKLLAAIFFIQSHSSPVLSRPILCVDVASSGFQPKPAAGSSSSSASPDPISSRVGSVSAFPNEYPGQIYAFNWCLNGDGVTPLKKSAFRITKPLDLKVAGLEPPKKIPLMVSAPFCFVRGSAFLLKFSEG
jgi:hypothetical protein